MEGQPPGQAETQSLAGKSGAAGRSVFGQLAGLNICYKLTALLGEWEGWRTTGGRVVEPQTTELSLAGDKGACQRHLPRPSPSQNPKGNQFLPGNLFAPRKHPTLCFCRSIPPAAGLTPSWCRRAPPKDDHERISELSLPLPPLCTLPIHPS